MKSFPLLIAAAVLCCAPVVDGGLPKVTVAPDNKGFVSSDGKPFVPFGVNYFRPNTGWAPQLWKKFDVEATRRDFELLKSYGVNCVRVFISAGSFYREPGVLMEEGLAKFDQFLAMAEAAGIYVHPTGPDHWEGSGTWMREDRYADPQVIAALESFWKLFAARYKGRNVIFAYDLLNEPSVRWESAAMRRRWERWVKDHYQSVGKAADAWGRPELAKMDFAPIPKAEDKPGDQMLLDYQRCREDVADEWSSRQVSAIKSADPQALVTIGYIQWSVPYLLPKLELYSGFRPQRQAKFLDFMEIHFYPLDGGALDYANVEQEQRNLAYVEAITAEVARVGKPVVMAEFGWHGGGTFPQGQRQSKHGSEADQARWCRRLVETTAPIASGWLNWGFYDTPEARDVSARTGLITADGTEKAWGAAFRELSAKYRSGQDLGRGIGPRPPLPWDACLTSLKAAAGFRQTYFRAFVDDQRK